MSRIHTILSSIATEISDNMHDNTRDQREDLLIQEIDSALTYYSTQWDILNEARPSTFELEQLGELAQSPAELAFDILYTTFVNEYWGALEDVEESPESDSSSKVDQLIDDGLVPIDHVTDRLDLIESIKKRDASLSEELSNLMNMAEETNCAFCGKHITSEDFLLSDICKDCK